MRTGLSLRDLSAAHASSLPDKNRTIRISESTTARILCFMLCASGSRAAPRNTRLETRKLKTSLKCIGDFLRETEVEDAFGRGQLLWFDTLGRDGDHLALQFLIHCT